MSQEMEAARREYEALLIENAARGKGGRPRKKAQPARDEELDEMLDEVEGGADETSEDEAAEE